MGTGTVKQLEDYTIKSRLVKNSEKVLSKIHSSDDPLRELGPGDTYWQRRLTQRQCHSLDPNTLVWLTEL